MLIFFLFYLNALTRLSKRSTNESRYLVLLTYSVRELNVLLRRHPCARLIIRLNFPSSASLIAFLFFSFLFFLLYYGRGSDELFPVIQISRRSLVNLITCLFSL